MSLPDSIEVRALTNYCRTLEWRLELARQVIDDQKTHLRTAGRMLLAVQHLTQSDISKMTAWIGDYVNHANVCIERADCSDPLQLEESHER